MLFLEPTMNAPHAMIGTTLTSKIIPPTVGKDDPLRIEVEEFRHIHAFGRYEKSDGREMDEYDIDATYLTVHEGDVLVGACRIVDKKNGKLLPIQVRRDFMDIPEGIPTGEISRICFAFHTQDGAGIRELLYRTIFDFTVAQGYDVCYASLQPYYFRFLDKKFGNRMIQRIAPDARRLKDGVEKVYVPAVITMKNWAHYYSISG